MIVPSIVPFCSPIVPAESTETPGIRGLQRGYRGVMGLKIPRP